jgi:hypothetical protein
MNQYGFYLNGQTLLRKVVCSSIEAAKKKLNLLYPENFNIEIKLIKKNVSI